MKIIWFVESGPDGSHLFETRVFYRLKDAKEFVKNLPPTPLGEKRPFKIKRQEF